MQVANNGIFDTLRSFSTQTEKSVNVNYREMLGKLFRVKTMLGHVPRTIKSSVDSAATKLRDALLRVGFHQYKTESHVSRAQVNLSKALTGKVKAKEVHKIERLTTKLKFVDVEIKKLKTKGVAPEKIKNLEVLRDKVKFILDACHDWMETERLVASAKKISEEVKPLVRRAMQAMVAEKNAPKLGEYIDSLESPSLAERAKITKDNSVKLGEYAASLKSQCAGAGDVPPPLPTSPPPPQTKMRTVFPQDVSSPVAPSLTSAMETDFTAPVR